MYTAKQMIVVRRDLKMRKGKIAAQAGHACVNAVLMALAKENRLDKVVFNEYGATLTGVSENDSPLCGWFLNGEAKICVYVDSEEALLEIDRKAKEAGILCALIQDAGHTEFHGEPTFTCLAFEPQLPEKVDPITGELPLF
jgi:PTH2 family peptidyl-tRNA hydrolase